MSEIQGQRESGPLVWLANCATEVFNPFLLVAAILTWVCWLSDPHWIRTSAITVVFIAVIPFTLSLVMAWSGKTSDRYIRVRQQRNLFYALTLISLAVGLLLVFLIDSSSQARWMSVVAVATLLLVMAINTRLKISIHALMAALALIIFPAGFMHPALILALTGIWALVCWSRVHIQRHQLTEVVAGSVAGAVVGCIYLFIVGGLPTAG